MDNLQRGERFSREHLSSPIPLLAQFRLPELKRHFQQYQPALHSV